MKWKGGEWYEARARRLAKTTMSVADGESYEPLDEGHKLPHSLDVQATKIIIL